MKIELKIKRKNGSRIELGEKVYHFKPDEKDPDGPHVAEVTEQAHIERLLAIPEYVPATDTAASRKAKEQAEQNAEDEGKTDSNTGIGGVSLVYDSGAGVDSPANTPQSAKPTPAEAEAALKAEHAAQEKGEGGSQSPEHQGKDEKEGGTPAKASKTAAPKSSKASK